MKATYFLILAVILLPAAGYSQSADRAESENRATAADIIRGRVGGDSTRSSTGVVISGANANLGAGSYTLMGATAEGAIPEDAAAKTSGLEAFGATTEEVTPIKRNLPSGSAGVAPRMDEKSDVDPEGDMKMDGTMETQPVFSGVSTSDER